MSRVAELEGFDHRATITLSNPYDDIDATTKQIEEIQEWILQLTKWQPDKFRVTYSHKVGRFHIWFREETHATLCRLKWS